MDYTKIPLELIYKVRDNLKDFEVQTPETMNYQLFMQLKKHALMGVPGARDVALRCYNIAYYVCTLILLEENEFPELRISDYVDTILEIEKDKGHVDEVCLASMAMACRLLANYAPQKYGVDSDIWKNINYRCTHYQWYNSAATEIFHIIVSWKYIPTLPLPDTEFAPRDIIEAIEEAGKDKPYYLEQGIEYICERLASTDDIRRRIYGADLTIAHLRDYLRDSYESWGYDPKTKSFEPAAFGTFGAEPDYEECFWNHVNPIKEAIKYIENHYPSKEGNDTKDSNKIAAESPQTSEVEVLQATIRNLESKLKHQEKQLGEANNINNQLVTRIKELEAEVIPKKDLEEDLEELRKWKQLSREQVALFCHALAEFCKFAQKTKQGDIAPMAHKLFGIGKKSVYNLMVSGYSKAEREHVAKIFETIWPQFADFIMNTFDKKITS